MISDDGLRTREAASTASALVLVIAIAFVDKTLWGHELSSSILYLVPIWFVAWYGRSRPGALFVALVAAIAWHVVDGSRTIYSNPAAPYWNSSVRLAFFVITASFIVTARRSLEREAQLADTDALTGLSNSRRFHEILESEFMQMKRTGRSCTVGLLDLDNFKEINDQHGHDTGDLALREVASLLRESAREIDVVARLGGDEFALLLQETDQAGTETVLERLRIQLRLLMDEHGWPVTCSIGAIVFTRPPASGEFAISLADELMYEVKGISKDGLLVQTYDGSEYPDGGI